MRFKPENICPACGDTDCINPMCASYNLEPQLELMLGDEEIPQLGTDEAGRFFAPLDYEELSDI